MARRISSDALSTLSGSTVVDSTVVNAGDTSDARSSRRSSLSFNGLDNDWTSESISADEELRHLISGMPDDDPVFPDDFENDEAFQGAEGHWFQAVARRLPVWFRNLPFMSYLSIYDIANQDMSEDSSEDYSPDNESDNHPSDNESSSLEPSADEPQIDHASEVPTRSLSHFPLLRPTAATAAAFCQILVPTLLGNMELIFSLMKLGRTPKKLILLGRLFVGMLVSFSSAFIAARHSRSGGRGEGEVVFMTQFWAGFFSARAVTLAVNRYDRLMERTLAA